VEYDAKEKKTQTKKLSVNSMLAELRGIAGSR
jgi:hypothetical protein